MYIDPPTVLFDGNIQFKLADCTTPHTNPVFGINSAFCITWDPDLFQIKGCLDSVSRANKSGNATLYFLGDTSLPAVDEGPWKTIDPYDIAFFFIFNQPSINEGKLEFTFQLLPTDFKELDEPKVVLMFIQISVEVQGITIFYSTPLVSYLPKILSPEEGGIKLSGAPPTDTEDQCKSATRLITAHDVSSLPPCPRNSDQAFLDPALEVDQGCSRKDPSPPYNCHFNPQAVECFLQK